MKQTKKALLMSVVSLLIFASMLIGSTYAWFTDSVSSMGNKIMAGTLKVDLELLDAKSGEWSSIKESKLPLFNYDKWEPGYVDTKVLKVENEGSLALRWAAKLYTEDDLSILCDAIDVYVLPSENEIDYPIGRSLDGYTLVGTLRNFIDTIEETTYGTLEAGECAYLGIALKMRENAGNEYQGLSLGGAFDIRIVATQYSFESDSFDDQYDVNPAEPVIAARSATFSEGETEVTLPLYHKGEQLLEVNVPAGSLVDPTKPVTVVIDDIEPTFEVDANTRVFAYDINVTNIRSGLSEDEFITITVKLPKGLAGVKAYHNGKLIEDAVYDSATGNITFKTSHFSPFEFTTAEYEAATLADLRKYTSGGNEYNGAYIKLTQNIDIDLSKGSADRDTNLTVSGYHNAVHVKGTDVAVDLNGHSITLYCGDKYNSNSDVGALFYVGENSSLNITDTVGGGFIKMRNSVYAVWAPHAGPSYVDIHSGIFIADSYAGDPLHTADTDKTDNKMTNENSCRTLIYAGPGGNINVYGGYFIYENTPNDTLNRNNGAFNAKDHYKTETPFITIHEGVMLINEEYRQNPKNTSTPNGTFDDESIKLAGEDEGLNKISEVTLDEPLLIDGNNYSTWYRVSRAYQYKLTFKDAAGEDLDSMYIWPSDGAVNVADKDDVALGKLTGDYKTYFDAWANVGSDKISTIPADNTTDIVLYPTMKQRFTVRWVDENGNVINSTTATKDTKYSSLTAPQNPESTYNNMEFDHWEIREKDSSGKVTYTAISSSYKITKNITLYPYYTYNGGEGSIALQGHDTDGDGRYDYYTVEAAAGLSGSVTIPGIVNGVPVTAITDLSGDTVNGLLGGGINSVIIKDGVTEIGSDAFAGTASLNYVEVPTSVTKIGSNAFSSGWGVVISKKVTIKYAGTWAQWQAACGGAGSDTNWDSGLGDGSTVECTDGNYRLSAGRFEGNHTWSDWKKQ